MLDAAGELKKLGRGDIKLVFIGDGREKPRLGDAPAFARALMLLGDGFVGFLERAAGG